jgi:hypothetical protein
MSLIEAKLLIKRFRSHGIKVTLFNGQPCFSTLDNVSGEDKTKITRLGTFLKLALREEAVVREARINLRETSKRLAERKRRRDERILPDTPSDEL